MGRSQRHKKYVQGFDSSGSAGPGGGPPPVSFAPVVASLAAAGATGRTIATLVPTGGLAPYVWSIVTAAGVSAQFVGNLLQTTVNPAGTVALHTMSISVRDQRGFVFTNSLAVTLT